MSATKRHRRARRVAVVTGTRADYGLLRSTMEAIAEHRSLELQTVVAGMHLLRKFGHTADELLRDGWRADAKVRMQAGDDNPLDQADGLSRGVAGIAKFCVRAGTDIVVVLGDRIEALAGALAATTTGRVLAHIHGGDLAPGDFDDRLRHAITKLAHVHLTATRAAAARIIRMGEHRQRVFWVGAPGLDRITALAGPMKPRRKPSGRALVLLHPCGRTTGRERRAMEVVLQAVDDARLTATVIYPNSDRGHSGIVRAIERWSRRLPACGGTRIVRSLDRDTYLRLLLETDVLIGNSSSGIIEAPAAGTPTVNVGPRQQGRQRVGHTVVDADESLDSIRAAIKRALRIRPVTGRSTVYGQGNAGRQVARILAQIPLHDRFRHKINSY